MTTRTAVDVERREFSLSLSRPLSTAHGTIEHREGWLIRVVDDSDTVGLGEATPLSGWTESTEECRSALEEAVPALEGTELPEVGGEPLVGDHPALPSGADTPAARHGIAMALLDLAARRCRVPLYRVLGAPEWVRSVPVNATVGDGTVTATAQTAVARVREGFGCLKVKVGARTVGEDVERLGAIEDVVDDGVAVRADANGSWSRKQARRALSALDDRGVDLDYLEAPLAAGDLEGLAQLRDDHRTAIAVDETLAETPPEEVFAASGADVLVCKPMVLGGLDRAVEVARSAREHGCRAVVTTTVDGVVARTGAVHVAASLPDPPPCGLATADRLATDLGPDPAPIEAGRATVPQEDGTGRPSGWWPTDDER